MIRATSLDSNLVFLSSLDFMRTLTTSAVYLSLLDVNTFRFDKGFSLAVYVTLNFDTEVYLKLEENKRKHLNTNNDDVINL